MPSIYGNLLAVQVIGLCGKHPAGGSRLDRLMHGLEFLRVLRHHGNETVPDTAHVITSDGPLADPAAPVGVQP